VKFNCKVGDSVCIPKGTPSKFFSGSLLDANPFVEEPFEYDALGKIIQIEDGHIAIEIWGRQFIANIDPKNAHHVKPTDKILTFDHFIGGGVYQIFDPQNLPPWNSREYDVEAEAVKDKNDNNREWNVERRIWATSRKHAIELVKKLDMEEYGNEGEKYRCRLAWKNQSPFTKDFYNMLLATKARGEKLRQ